VLAPAKTRVSHHAHHPHSSRSKGVDPRQILAVTFTKQGCRERDARAHRSYPRQRSEGDVAGTFHAIRRRARCYARPRTSRRARRSFTIYDQDDSGRGRQAIDGAGTAFRRSSSAARAFSRPFPTPRTALVTYREYERWHGSVLKAVAARLSLDGEALRRRTPSTSTILLVLPCRMLSSTRNSWPNTAVRFQYISRRRVSGHQRAQYELIKLPRREHGNVCVVGGRRSVDLRWRGADIRNILDFNKDFQDATVVRLEETTGPHRHSRPRESRHQRQHGRMGKTAARHASLRRAVTVVRSLDERDEADSSRPS
jgi:DNA helicase-2/ATP-dependent DNA helicase PcrA